MEKEFLQKIPFFSDLSEEKLAHLASSGEVVKTSSTELLFHEGDLADALYIVLEGSVRIFTFNTEKKKIVLALLQRGECFGEQVFSHALSPRRTASAESPLPSTLFKIPRQPLRELGEEQLHLQEVMKERFRTYLSSKIVKLAQNLPDLSRFFQETRSVQPSEVLYYQGDPADHLYILHHGAVELRTFNEEKQLEGCIEMGLGEFFGNEALQEKGCYKNTAVAQQESEVIVISREKLHSLVEEAPELCAYIQQSGNRYATVDYGRVIQFRGHYEGMAALISILMLEDGREIICTQAAGAPFSQITTAGVLPSRTLNYAQESAQLELHLVKDRLVGFSTVGEWEGSDQLLGAIIERKFLPDHILETFQQGGNIELSPTVAADPSLVCSCMRVKRARVEKLIQKGECSLEIIQQQTRASTICGSCKPEILQMLGEEVWVACKVVPTHTHQMRIQTFQLHPLHAHAISFSPGQHLIVRTEIGGLPIQRSYTLTGHPEGTYFEITVKLEEGGQFSPWLFASAHSHPLVYVSSPYGEFALKEDDSAICCFAGGVGVTPFIAFGRMLVREASRRRFILDYSVITHDEVIFSQELESWMETLNDAHIHFRETSIQGTISKEEILHLVHTAGDAYFYICGPQPYEEWILETLREASVPQDRILTEKFYHAGSLTKELEMVSF